MKTEIVIVLDRSGSMGRIRDEVIEGLNSFITEQKKVTDDECFVTFIQFDDEYEPLFFGKPLDEVDIFTHQDFRPRGMTALYDAIGKTINATRARNETGGVDKTMMVIMTDGYENASKEFTGSMIPDMLSEVREKDSWEVMYLGAGIDEEKAAKALNLDVNLVSNWIPEKESARETFTSYGSTMSMARKRMSEGSVGLHGGLASTGTETDWKSGVAGTQAVYSNTEEENEQTDD